VCEKQEVRTNLETFAVTETEIWVDE